MCARTGDLCVSHMTSASLPGDNGILLAFVNARHRASSARSSQSGTSSEAVGSDCVGGCASYCARVGILIFTS